MRACCCRSSLAQKSPPALALGGFFGLSYYLLFRLLLGRIGVTTWLVGPGRQYFIYVAPRRIAFYFVSRLRKRVLIGVLHLRSAAIGAAVRTGCYRVGIILRRVGGYRFRLRRLLIFCHSSRELRVRRLLLLFTPLSRIWLLNPPEARTQKSPPTISAGGLFCVF